jgi:hypothetical protein
MNIWTRRTKILEPRAALILRPQVAGRWKLEAIRPDGRRRLLADWFPNLIVDGGLDLPGQNGQFISACAVGTGNSAPDFSDTGLDSQIAVTATKVSAPNGSNETADRYCWTRVVFRFSTGTAAGNLAEIGIKCTSPDKFLSRALILDGDGDPATITVLADEVLDATYEFRVYPPLSDVPGVMTVSGEDYDVVMRTAVVGQWTLQHGGLGGGQGFSAGASTLQAALYPSTSTLGAVTTGPTGSSEVSNVFGGTTSTYVPGSYVSDFGYTFDLDHGNVSGGAAAALIPVGSRATSDSGAAHFFFQMSIDPPLPKDNTNNLVLNFRSSWARRTL